MRIQRPALLIIALSGGLLAAGCSVVLGIEDLPSADAGAASAHDASVDAGPGADGGGTSTDAGDATTGGDGALPGDGGSDGGSSPAQFDDLHPADAGTGALFGSSLAFSADGKWLAIGAPGAPGAVYLYAYDATTSTWLPNTTFTEVQFSASSGTGDGFGTAVAFSAAENDEPLTLAMSAPSRTGGGAVYRATLPTAASSFVRSANALDPPADAGAAGFGAALGYGQLYGDLLVVSAPASPVAPGVLFEYPEDAGAEAGVLVKGAQSGDAFGASLAAADNHTSFVVGSPGYGSGDTAAIGQVLLGDMTSGALRYIQAQPYVPHARFGSAVAFSPEVGLAHFLFVGQPGVGGTTSPALVYAYDFEGTLNDDSVPIENVVAPSGSVAFGSALAASSTTVAVGAPGTGSSAVTGGVYLYPLPTNPAPTQLPPPITLNSPSGLDARALFGSALAFVVPPVGNAVSSVLAVGAPGQGVGHVYLYR